LSELGIQELGSESGGSSGICSEGDTADEPEDGKSDGWLVNDKSLVDN